MYRARASLADGTARELALKVYLDAADDPAIFAHLTRALEPALACQHEAVVRTLELRTVDTVMVVAMELVDGVDLGDLLSSMAGGGSRLSTGVALHLARGLLSGLDCFHSLRDRQGRALPVVHGYLHPGNVLLSRAGEVKIADFITSLMVSVPGAARRARAALYRSPEQATGDAVDHRTDLFNVGLLLYEVLAGGPAYDADELEDPAELEDVICEADIVPLEEQVSGLPPQLYAVLARALAPEPGERFSAAREMLSALEPLMGSPEVAGARGALAGLVSEVTPRVLAARQLELAVRAEATMAPRPERETAILPTGPHGAAEPIRAPEPSDRRTEVMAAAVAEGEYDGTEFLHCSELKQLLARKDRQRTVAGLEPVRECTLFWSAEDARRTETRAAPRAAWPRVAMLVVAVCALGLGAGAAVSHLWAPTPARVLPLNDGAAPLTVGPWRLELLRGGRVGEGPLEVSVRLGHARAAPSAPGTLFALERDGGFASPDFWSHRVVGHRQVEVKLVFKEGVAPPSRLRFAPDGIPPVVLLLGAERQKKRP